MASFFLFVWSRFSIKASQEQDGNPSWHRSTGPGRKSVAHLNRGHRLVNFILGYIRVLSQSLCELGSRFISRDYSIQGS